MFRRTGLIAAALAVAALAGCSADVQPVRLTTTREINVNRASPKDLREHVSVNGVLAGAEAGRQMLVVHQVPAAPDAPLPPAAVVAPVPPAPPAPPVPAVVVRTASGQTVQVVTNVPAPSPKPAVRPAAIRFTVRSEKPASTEPVAVADAVATARVELMKRLQALDPPVVASPTMVGMRTEYIKEKRAVQPSEADRELWKAAGLSPNQVYAEVDVEVSESQVQKLRASERVGGALKVTALVFAVLLAAHGFFRLDAWTKGYLTGWLALGAVVLVGGTALFLLA